MIVEGEAFVQFGWDYYMYVGFYEDHVFYLEDLLQDGRLHTREKSAEPALSDQFSAVISLVEGRAYDPDQTALVEPSRRWPKDD